MVKGTRAPHVTATTPPATSRPPTAGFPFAPELGSSGLVWQRLRLDAPSARARERSGLGPTASKVTDSTAFGHAGAVFVLCSQHITHPHEPVVSAMPHLIVGIAIVSR